MLRATSSSWWSRSAARCVCHFRAKWSRAARDDLIPAVLVRWWAAAYRNSVDQVQRNHGRRPVVANAIAGATIRAQARVGAGATVARALGELDCRRLQRHRCENRGERRVQARWASRGVPRSGGLGHSAVIRSSMSRGGAAAHGGRVPRRAGGRAAEGRRAARGSRPSRRRELIAAPRDSIGRRARRVVGIASDYGRAVCGKPGA